MSGAAPKLVRTAVMLAGLACTGVLPGCSDQEDVAGIVLSDGALAGDLGEGGVAAANGGAGADAAGALVIVGHPLRSIAWPEPYAAWPLSAPLAEFFAGARGEREPVRVEGDDGELLRDLWRAVERGEYGSRGNVVGVVDRVEERYLLVFQAP